MSLKGTHAAQLVKNDGEWLQFGRSGKEGDGKPRVLLTFELGTGVKFQDSLYLTPAAMKYTIDKLHVCGFTGSDLRTMANQTPHGKVELVIEEEDYKGDLRPKIKFINPQGGFSIKKEHRLSLDELAELSELATPAADDDDVRF